MTESTILFRRTAGWRDLLRAYSIEVDGKQVGKVRRGEDLTVEVGPGTHRAQAAIDWARSPVCEVVTEVGGTTEVTVAPAGGVFASLFRPKEYISLTVEAKIQ